MNMRRKRNILKETWNLHAAKETEKAGEENGETDGERVPQDPMRRIDNYLKRFEEILEREDGKKRERGLRALRNILRNKFVIKPEDIPERYFALQRRIARDEGHGDIELTEELKEQLTEAVIADQRSTLDNWIDYLSSPDALYPTWTKYWALRSVLGLSTYDKEKHRFNRRDKGTTAPFPDLNREALAYVTDIIQKQGEKRGYRQPRQSGEKTVMPKRRNESPTKSSKKYSTPRTSRSTTPSP